MDIEIIGTWAGTVWSALDEKGPQTIKEIKKDTKLREKDIYAAIGWLAREGKVKVVETGSDKEVAIALV